MEYCYQSSSLSKETDFKSDIHRFEDKGKQARWVKEAIKRNDNWTREFVKYRHTILRGVTIGKRDASCKQNFAFPTHTHACVFIQNITLWTADGIIYNAHTGYSQVKINRLGQIDNNFINRYLSKLVPHVLCPFISLSFLFSFFSLLPSLLFFVEKVNEVRKWSIEKGHNGGAIWEIKN